MFQTHPGFSGHFKALAWHAAGFGWPALAVAWHAAGLGLGMALAWYAAGLGLGMALAWYAAGLGLGMALAWYAAGLGLGMALAWYAAGLGLGMALAWYAAGLGLGMALAWYAAGLGLGMALAWYAAGLGLGMDFLSREVGEFLSGSLAGVVTKAVLAPFETIRYGYNRRWSEDEKGMGNNFTRTQIRAHKKRRLSFLPQACFALVTTRNSTLTNFYQEVIEAARERFTREISFQSKDKDISLAKSPGLLAAFLVWLSAATL
ncbi:hypothetical protein TEA_029923 [Camellia sinensis var. sinensis]|uniref:Uncharacterized protein n=1 Tax=Camellia sinensis var. sinensis TaxID=542762 RepID=A0A4S4EIT2_CAMSN|nr:hypothetical protein TEA_029923 [Camellia sinensis var. sinensis]